MSIIVEKVTKKYRGAPGDALHAVSLTCEEGVFGLLGPNGAGKTTLMRIIATLIAPSSGRVTVEGYSVLKEPSRVRALIGYLPQEYALYPHLSAWEFLEYMGMLSGVKGLSGRIEEVLTQVGLLAIARRRLATFSSGMKQRVAIAQALLHRPPVLLVDEPTAGLDPAERVRFRNLLADLGRARTILLSTHIVEDVVATCRQVTVLSEGEIAFSGEIDSLVSFAQGKVWEATLSPGEWERIRHDYPIVSSRPGGSTDFMKVRFLVPETRPPFDAQTVSPTIEDAYLLLISARQAADGPISNIASGRL